MEEAEESAVNGGVGVFVQQAEARSFAPPSLDSGFSFLNDHVINYQNAPRSRITAQGCLLFVFAIIHQ